MFFAAGLAFLLASSTNAQTGFATKIKCVDLRQNSLMNVEVAFNLLENNGYLKYQSAQGQKAFIGIDKPFGYGASASFKIESNVENRLSPEQEIIISGFRSQTTRVSSYSSFSLHLTKNKDNSYSFVKLDFSEGSNAYPERHISESIDGISMSCTFEMAN